MGSCSRFPSWFFPVILFLLNEIHGCMSNWEHWWTYDGISGPLFWGVMNPQWSLCDRGRIQSPVDIDPDKLLYDPQLRSLHMDKNKINGLLQNTGQSLTLRPAKETKLHVNITGGPLSYKYQFHEMFIHYGMENAFGSEHRIQGKSYPAEIQLYFFNSDLYRNMSEARLKSQGIAALSIMVQKGPSSEEIRVITSNFTDVVYGGQSAKIRNLSLRNLLPDTDFYMTYEGSTTHPGCWETVTWIVFNKPVYMTRQENISVIEWPTGTAEKIRFTGLEITLAKYQNPKEADGITKLQYELDDTKIILHNTMEAVLQRGEKLDDLVAKSEGLSAQSKLFYKTARKANSCYSTERFEFDIALK
ncbi:unnamed protein product [Cyprideis torosa]|uniref:Uncharacterized protein n=1 Tax=Cyprideis torosa TaxID=163714 RepID=A0A7R8ZJ39_9CRUS|nr:unnamed protein product [Cyprideis torosa]CAG0881443.1 unnamed protein product [Cyprideis torosa]